MGAGVVLHLPAWAMPLGSPLSPGGHLLGGLPQQAKAQDVCAPFWVLHGDFSPVVLLWEGAEDPNSMF